MRHPLRCRLRSSTESRDARRRAWTKGSEGPPLWRGGVGGDPLGNDGVQLGNCPKRSERGWEVWKQNRGELRGDFCRGQFA